MKPYSEVSELEARLAHLEAENQQLKEELVACVETTIRLLEDKPDEHGNYVHLLICNFSRRKSVTQARCNCPISRELASKRVEAAESSLSHLTRGLEGLQKYVQHKALCAHQRFPHAPGDPEGRCICGLADLIASIPRDEKEHEQKK